MKDTMLTNPVRLTLARERFFRYLVDGQRDPSESDIQKRMLLLGLTEPSPLYAIVEISLHIDMYPTGYMDETLLSIEDRVLSSLQKSSWKAWTYIDSRYCLVVILGADCQDAFIELDPTLARIIHELTVKYGIVIYAGIGCVVNSLTKLKLSAKDADLCLAHKYSMARENVINIKNVRKVLASNPAENSTAFDRVIGCFLDGDLQRLNIRLNELLNQMSYDSSGIKQAYLELFTQILRHTVDSGIQIPNEQTGEYLQYVVRESNLHLLKAWFIERCSSFIQQMSVKRQESTSNIAEAAKKFVERNYSDPSLSQQSVSDYLSLSVGYFGQLFFSQTGQRFIDYLHQYRMEVAKNRLETTNDKVKDISIAVGFGSANYFANLFKKQFNLTPKEYRMRINK